VEVKRLLLIDEDRAARDALQEVFISRNWEVAMVATQCEAMRLLTDYDPDWVIVPREHLDGTGERFLLELRNRSRTTRVALLTSPMDPVERRTASRLKPDIQITRPVLPEAVFLACEPCWSERWFVEGHELSRYAIVTESPSPTGIVSASRVIRTAGGVSPGPRGVSA
jgi:DNA-binding NarL/FixJ family response regulator